MRNTNSEDLSRRRVRTFLDGTDDGGGISESSGVSEEPADPQAVCVVSSQTRTPVDVEGVAAATPQLLGTSSRLHRAGGVPVTAQNSMVDPVAAPKMPDEALRCQRSESVEDRDVSLVEHAAVATTVPGRAAMRLFQVSGAMHSLPNLRTRGTQRHARRTDLLVGRMGGGAGTTRTMATSLNRAWRGGEPSPPGNSQSNSPSHRHSAAAPTCRVRKWASTTLPRPPD
jgi:hypothetical protein